MLKPSSNPNQGVRWLCVSLFITFYSVCAFHMVLESSSGYVMDQEIHSNALMVGQLNTPHFDNAQHSYYLGQSDAYHNVHQNLLGWDNLMLWFGIGLLIAIAVSLIKLLMARSGVADHE